MEITRLRALSEQHRGKIYELTADKYTVGRVEQRDICINDPTISTYHCTFEKKGNSYFIKDCGSTNGTRINHFPIVGEQELHNSDIVVLGSVEFLYDCEGKTVVTSTSTQTQIKLEKGVEKPLPVMANFSPYDKARKIQAKIQKNIFFYGLFVLMVAIIILIIFFKGVLFHG